MEIYWLLQKSDNESKVTLMVATQVTLPWLFIGDFNEILDMKEKLGGSKRKSHQINSFRQAIDKEGLYDLGFSGSRYT